MKADLGLGKEAKKFNLGVDGRGNLVLVPVKKGQGEVLEIGLKLDEIVRK